MITPNFQCARIGLCAALLAAFGAAACEKVPLLAPSGSTITLTAATNALPVNGSIDIIAQVIEAAGTPPHSGTHVIFTTTLGTIQPSEATTDINGRVVVKFFAGAANGTATITASSGAATTGTAGAVRVAVGTAAVGRVIVNASPASVPAIGGTTTISANVLDVNGNPLTSTPVTFSTTAGSLGAPVVTTDANGVAATTLTTGQQATVTASVGAQGGSTTPTTPPGGTTPTPAPGTAGQASGSVTVTIAAVPTLVITPPSTPPSVGVPAAFTFNVTVAANGSAVRDVRVNWGDGDSQSLGAVSGNAVVSHVYRGPGTYAVTGTVTDASGNSSSVGTSVTVIPVPRPTVIVTATPQTQNVNGNISFNIQVTTAPGIGVQRTRINFGNGEETRELGGATSTTVTKQYASPGPRTVTVTVTDTTNTDTEGSTTVSIIP